MFTIIRWIFSIALLILVIYLVLLAYNAIKKEGISNFLDPVTSGISSLFNGAGMTTTATTTKSFLADFFAPRQIAAPLVVVPSSAWYENMDEIYKQIYLNNLNYTGMNTNGTFNYDAYFQKYNPEAIATNPVQSTSSTKLQLLFPTPSTYMQLRNNMSNIK